MWVCLHFCQHLRFGAKDSRREWADGSHFFLFFWLLLFCLKTVRRLVKNCVPPLTGAHTTRLSSISQTQIWSAIPAASQRCVGVRCMERLCVAVQMRNALSTMYLTAVFAPSQAVAACEAVDKCLGDVISSVEKLGGNLVRTTNSLKCYYRNATVV